MSVTEQFSTGLTTIMAAAEQWYRSIDPDFTDELDEASERAQRVRRHIVKHIVLLERNGLPEKQWDADYHAATKKWRWEE